MHQHWAAARVGVGRFSDPETTQRPIIVANPRGDTEFRNFITVAMRSGGWRPEDLEAFLRERYPLAIVRRRELAGERQQVWYVYRDGHWIGSDLDAGA